MHHKIRLLITSMDVACNYWRMVPSPPSPPPTVLHTYIAGIIINLFEIGYVNQNDFSSLPHLLRLPSIKNLILCLVPKIFNCIKRTNHLYFHMSFISFFIFHCVCAALHFSFLFIVFFSDSPSLSHFAIPNSIFFSHFDSYSLCLQGMK